MEELVIRSAVTSDAAGIAAIYAPYVRDTAFSFEDVPPTATQMAGRIEEISNSYPFLVAERGGVPVGYAYGTSHRSRTAYRFSADVSIYLDASVQRQGIGRRLYGELFERLCAQDIRMVFAGISLPNPPSIALHEAMGFTAVGIYKDVGFKFGRWIDTGWWQKRL